jgi:hypothetical protein
MARTKVRGVAIKDGMWEALRELGVKENRNMSELIREALNDLFDKKSRRNYDPVSDRFK